MQPDQVYDLLKGLEGDALQIAKDLFVLAGQLWMSNGYFFERQSLDVLDKFNEVEIYDVEKNELVGTLAHPNLIIEQVTFGGDPRFLPGKKYRAVTKATPEVMEQLRKLRNAIYDNLRKLDSRKFGEEYTLIGSMVGGQGLTDDQLREKIEAAFDKGQKQE